MNLLDVVMLAVAFAALFGFIVMIVVASDMISCLQKGSDVEKVSLIPQELLQEVIRRRDRDGEVFLRFFTTAKGALGISFVDPSEIRRPGL